MENTYYLTNITEVTNKLKRDIEQGEVTLGEISIFYGNKPEEKLDQKLFERMTTLNLNSKEKGEKYKRIIDNFYSAINLVLSDLQVILEDLLEFYLNKESKNIEEIKTIINDLKKGLFFLQLIKKKQIKRLRIKRVNFFGLYITKIKKNIKIMRILVLMKQ